MDIACLDRINECKKKLGLIVDIIKVYKVWVKKGNDAEFIAEMQRFMDFAAGGDTAVQLDLPVCIKQDLMEASFCQGALTASGSGDEQDMSAVWKDVSLVKISGFLGPDSDTAGNFQRRLTELVFIKLLRDSKEVREEAEFEELVSSLDAPAHCVLC